MMTRNFEQFGPTIREARKALNATQAQVCEQVGISVTYLSKIEHGAQPPPSESTILLLARFLSINSDELIRLAGRLPSDLYAWAVSSPEAIGHIRHLAHQPSWKPDSCDVCQQFQAFSGGASEQTRVQAERVER